MRAQVGGALPGSCNSPSLCYIAPALSDSSQDGPRLTEVHSRGFQKSEETVPLLCPQTSRTVRILMQTPHGPPVTA